MIKIDRHTVIQVLGGLMNQPNFLSDTDKYRIELSDFPQTLDKFIFSAINNLYNGGEGANNIRTIDVINYLKENEVANKLIEKENGETFIKDCELNGEAENFNYYYNKLKKLNLVKDIQSSGRDTSDIYCEDILNPKYTEINERFEQMTTTDILNVLKLELNKYESKFVLGGQVSEMTAVDGIEELIVELKTKPEVGCKLQGEILNTICRGGRKGKFYIRSASSSVGKSRRAVGDACYIAYPVRFEPRLGKWVSTGSAEKVLYVMTEQDPSEIQTMILAYLTGYNEEMFLYGLYGEEEMPRIRQAIEIMKTYKDNMLFAQIPDPCASAVKNLFRRYNIQYGVENFFFDYIFSSPAMLNEYRDLKLPEFVCLRLFSTALKNLAVELNAFVMTSTQVSNDDNKDGGFRDFHQIQGSKQIINLADFACIMSRPTKEELSQIKDCCQGGILPNLVTDVFKNRRGRWTMVRIWSYNDLGCCRCEDLFVTTADMKPISDFRIVNFDLDFLGNFQHICDKFNKNSSAKSEVTNSYSISDIKPEDLYSAAEAFEDKGDIEKRVANKSFNDFLEF